MNCKSRVCLPGHMPSPSMAKLPARSAQDLAKGYNLSNEAGAITRQAREVLAEQDGLSNDGATSNCSPSLIGSKAPKPRPGALLCWLAWIRKSPRTRQKLTRSAFPNHTISNSSRLRSEMERGRLRPRDRKCKKRNCRNIWARAPRRQEPAYLTSPDRVDWLRS